MSYPTPSSPPPDSTRGVFDADPLNPPPPPPEARAIEIVDSTGRTIAYSWVLREHDDEDTTSTAWAWLKKHDANPSSVRPRLVR